MANRILWHKRISKQSKKRIYWTADKNIVIYTTKVWPLKDKTEKCWRWRKWTFGRRRQAGGITKMERITNYRISKIMQITRTAVEDKQLIWFGHVRIIPEERPTKQISQWKPGKRRQWEAAEWHWLEEMEEDTWNGRGGRRLGICLLYTSRCV